MCDHVVSLPDFKVLASGNSWVPFKNQGKSLISCDQPILNRNEASWTLYLFH